MELVEKAKAKEISGGFCHWTNIPKEIDKLPVIRAVPEEQINEMLSRIDEYKKDYIIKYGTTSVVFNDIMDIIKECCEIR